MDVAEVEGLKEAHHLNEGQGGQVGDRSTPESNGQGFRAESAPLAGRTEGSAHKGFEALALLAARRVIPLLQLRQDPGELGAGPAVEQHVPCWLGEVFVGGEQIRSESL